MQEIQKPEIQCVFKQSGRTVSLHVLFLCAHSFRDFNMKLQQ